MSLFGKKQEKGVKKDFSDLPDLPQLPDLSDYDDNDNEEDSDYSSRIHQLPSFANDSFSKKFSQSAIKEAVSGGKEGDRGSEVDEFPNFEKEEGMMQRPLRKKLTREYDDYSYDYEKNRDVPEEFQEAERKVRSVEPIFIRVDKFEESLKTFESTKEKIAEIERSLREISKVKEEEERELMSWDSELQEIKRQIEKIDRDLFSQV